MQTVSQDARLQPPPKQASEPVRGDDRTRGLRVADTDVVHLAVGLHNAKRVGHRIGDDGGTEAHERLPSQLLDEVVGSGKVFVEFVIRAEPL